MTRALSKPALVGACACLAVAAFGPVQSPPVAAQGTAAGNEAGFAPPEVSGFTALLKLAPAGPDQAAQALERFERFMELDRKMVLHPVIDSGLEQATRNLPPRQSTLIRATELYSRSDIPWITKPPHIHYLFVSGRPVDDNYVYSVASGFHIPEAAGDFSGFFALRPGDEASYGDLKSVIAELGGQIYPASFGFGDLVDAASEALRTVYGDLKPPWDTAPGSFNQHDGAALQRFARDLPAVAERVNHYLQFDNVLDEMEYEGQPTILFNLDARVREDALKPFLHLYRFYKLNAPRLQASSVIEDRDGHQWARMSFDGGRIRVQFLLRNGMLTPMDSDLRPAGAPTSWSQIETGHFVSRQSVRVHRMGMDFGLDNLVFATDFRRNGEDASFSTRMADVPHVIAPPVINKVILFIAGEFMEVLASGNGGRGLSTTLTSGHHLRGGSMFAGNVSGEFAYSPSLEFLARIGDSIADAHNELVRNDERRLGEEFLNALESDYYRARPILVKMRPVNGVAVQRASAQR